MIRSAASWKAFKEGKFLLDAGNVTESAAGASAWRGVVRSGGKPLRVKVTMRSATDFDVICPCRENRSGGAFCAHAVATGLATLAKTTSQTATLPDRSSNTTSATRPPSLASVPRPAAANLPWPACEIQFPPSWQEALARGKCVATLVPAPHPAVVHPALQVWLEQQGLAAKFPIHLQLDGPRAHAFLLALLGHGRVLNAKSKQLIEVTAGLPIPLRNVSRNHDGIRFEIESTLTKWAQLDSHPWGMTDQSLVCPSTGIPGNALSAHLGELTTRGQTLIPLQKFLTLVEPLQDWVLFPPDSWLDTLIFSPAEATFELDLDGSADVLSAKLAVRYAGENPLPPGLGVPLHLPCLVDFRCKVRHLEAEAQATHSLEAAGFLPHDLATGNWKLRGAPAILDFLARSLPTLQKCWQVRLSDRLAQTARTVSLVSPKIQILGANNDWLTFDLLFQTSDGGTIPAAEVRQWLAAGKPPSRRVQGKSLVLEEDALEWIEPLFAELDLRQNQGHYETDSRTGEIIREIQATLQGSAPHATKHEFHPIEPAKTLNVTLRGYQHHGLNWLMDRCERFGGALLADDMGLGKTIQTIAWVEGLLEQRVEGLVLVVASASLLGNWHSEWRKFAPARRLWIMHGSRRDAIREQAQEGDVILTSYGTLTRDLAWHLKRDYQAIIVDEASMIRNPDTDHAKALVKMRSKRRLALTGTPLENGVRDLWSIFRFIQPGWLGSRQEFRDHYELPLQDGDRTLTRSVMQRLKLKTQPFMLRRTKTQVAPELPGKILIDEFCDLSREQQAVYRELLLDGRRQVETASDAGNSGAARMKMLTVLLRLRQTCCDLSLLGNEKWQQLVVAQRSAKLQRLLELLEEAIAGDHRVLVFSQFQKQLLEIEALIATQGWSSLRLDGQSRNRQALVESFQSPDGPPIFLISLKAGGYGLNLTAADTVIHFDPWWNPAAETQATDRAHRIGQTRPVTVYRLLTRGTVEEKVVQLQAGKRELAAAIDETSEIPGDANGWTQEDLRKLLSEG